MIPVDTAVEFQDLVAAGGLVQAVDVLGDDGLQLSLGLLFRQLSVGGIGSGIGGQHLGPVEAEKFFRLAFIEGMA